MRVRGTHLLDGLGLRGGSRRGRLVVKHLCASISLQFDVTLDRHVKERECVSVCERERETKRERERARETVRGGERERKRERRDGS